MKDIPLLQKAIKETHGCDSTHVDSVPVVEKFNDQIAWKGFVEVFDLVGHPTAKRAYAWTYQEGKQNKTVAVLGIPPVDSPQIAVKIAIASKGRQTTPEKTVIAAPTEKPTSKWRDEYWFGYLYAAFWGFVTYSCGTHAIIVFGLLKSYGIPSEIEARSKFIATLILWPIMTLVGAWVTYRLITHQARLNFIIVLICVHAANVLAEGIIPMKLLLWIVLSAIVFFKFRERERLYFS